MTGFNTKFQAGLTSAESWADRLSMKVMSNSKVETYGWMRKLPKFREWVGPRVYNNLVSEDYVLVNKTFENTIAVDVDDIADDTVGVYAPHFQMLGESAKKWPDQQLKTVIQNGDASGALWDGVDFFDASHPMANTTQSNLFTGTALSATNYNTVRAAMMSYIGDDGEPLGVTPNLLVVPPALAKTAYEIVNAERNSAGATNVLRGTAEVLVIPELANESTVWYLIDDSNAVKPFVWQEREAPNIVQMDSANDEGVFTENQLRIGGKARGAAGYGLYWFAAKAVA